MYFFTMVTEKADKPNEKEIFENPFYLGLNIVSALFFSYNMCGKKRTYERHKMCT